MTEAEAAAWAAAIQDRALRLYNRTLREPFTGFCEAVFDDVRHRRYIYIGYHYESRVVAKYNIGKNDRLTRAKPTKHDDKLLQRYRSGVFYPIR